MMQGTPSPLHRPQFSPKGISQLGHHITISEGKGNQREDSPLLVAPARLASPREGRPPGQASVSTPLVAHCSRTLQPHTCTHTHTHTHTCMTTSG
mmetsp:Transcript_7880/g.16033  ORF Transcript_7880/g.16033 Transcript_7880/m.16033 type:complete len:95 (+) Transcript_7880:255-539(+)